MNGGPDPAAIPIPDVTIGQLRIPPPKAFTGREDDDGYEFETYSRQLKAYLSLQTIRYRELMNLAQESTIPIGMPADDADKPLARNLQNFLILTCTGKAGRIISRDDTDENGFESWRRLYVRYAPTKRVKFIGSIQKVLNWKLTDANLEQDLLDWENEIEKYEKSPGATPIPDDVKIGIYVDSPARNPEAPSIDDRNRLDIPRSSRHCSELV
jgi:hypothetical protein